MSAISKKNIQSSISIPSGLSNEFREELSRRIVEEIRDRTERGIDRNGKRFKAYSKSYKESLDFKNAGKSNTVNLSSTGDTLAELDVLSISNNSIIIGYDMDHEDAGKVNGIVTGEFGNSNPVTSGRDFIGLPDKVVRRLIAEISSEPEFTQTREESDSRIQSLLSRFF